MERLISMGNSIAEMANLFLVDYAIKGTVLLALGAIVVLFLRRDSAATRHLAWLLGMMALLVLPLLSILLPQWRVLPDWTGIQAKPSTPSISSPSLPNPVRNDDKIFEPKVMALPSTPVEFAPPPVQQDFPGEPVSKITPSQSPPWTIPWSFLLPVIWALGCSFLLLRLAGARLYLWYLERRSTWLWSSTKTSNSETDPLIESLSSASTQLEMHRPVSLWIHPQKTIPMVWGIIHSRLLLPLEARHWHPDQLRSVLLHELAHIKRYDTMTQLLTQLACALHWFNPLIWVAAWRMGVERERACDDLVLANGVQPSAYASHLLEIVTNLPANRGIPTGGLAMARKSSLESRLIAVLTKNINRRGVSFAIASFAMMIALCIAVPIAMLRAVEENLAAPGNSETGNPNSGEKLELSRLEGYWEGEKDGVKVEVKFPWLSEHQQVQWQVKRPNSTIGAEMSVVMKPDSSAANFVFRRGLEFEATQGRVTPGEDGTLLLEIIPNPHVGNPGYPATTGLLLKRVSGRHARLVPRIEAARPLYQKWKKNAEPDGTIPGKFLEQLGVGVNQFLKENPNQKWPHELHVKLAPPLISMANLAPEDAVFLLDEVAEISTKPIELLLNESAPGLPQPETSPKASTGTKLKPTTEQLLKWGEPTNGLRMALAWPPSLGELGPGNARDFLLVVQNVSAKQIQLTANDQFPNPRRMMIRRNGIPLSAIGDPTVMKGDWLLNPGEVAFLRLFRESEKIADGRTIGELKEETVRVFPQYTLSAEMTIEKAPPGSWTGKLKTGQTRGSLDVILPKNKEAQELYATWTTAARLDGKIPAGVIAKLGDSVKLFIKNNPTWATTPQLQTMLPRLEPRGDLPAQDAVALLDELATLQSTPIGMALTSENFLKIRTGTPLPESLSKSPWGEPLPNGLRLAWLLDSNSGAYPKGASLKARVLIHNAGKKPIVFRTRTWHQIEHKAKDAKGKEITADSVEWTSIGRLWPYRLAPGEFIEVSGPGIGLGTNQIKDNWKNIRVGTVLEVNQGDEITVSSGWVPLYDGYGKAELDGDSRWWLEHIKSRLERHLPFPPGKEARERLLYRIAMELFGTPVSREINDAFVADQSPTALDSLAQMLYRRPDLTAWSGSLISGQTVFIVLPPDPNAEQKLRLVREPGFYNLGENSRLFITSRAENERKINEALIEFFSKDPKNAAPGKPFNIPLPDGYNTWSAAWTKDSTTLWIRQKDSTKSYDFSNPAEIKETAFTGPDALTKIPKDIHEALGTITNGPDRPKTPPAATGR